MKIRTHDVDVFHLIVLPRYKNLHTNNTRHNSWDSSDIFYPLMLDFACWNDRSKNTTTLGGKEHIFLSGNGYHKGCPNVEGLNGVNR